MRDLPSGTVTLLFSDIEGSTRLLHEFGERYADVLAEHRRVLRDAFVRHRGVEVDSQGDAFFAAFVRASDAIAAASEAQTALGAGPVQVRIGIHTGEPTVTEDGYTGIDVHQAARIMSAGHGGQVLLSETTKDLADRAWEILDLGEHRLRDLSAPQHLYQLGATRFPPLKTLYRTTLPIQATPLVGRERELEEAGALLRSNRLLTLTGPGGSGKTRLALQLAADAVEAFPDGVFWVPLQAVRDPALVEHSIAAAVAAEGGLIEHVAAQQLLVLVDNFEQVIDAAPTIAALLAGTPNARVIVTSREPLHVEGEQQYPVEPLLDDDAATLFVERARAVVPEFQPTAAVRAICARLDRLPLAIELAAARVAILDADELLARLERRLPLLGSRSRDAPERQRTLHATIEWSYQLLEPHDQELFQRLAVFAGSFSSEAAESVCGADLDGLESLVTKNLLRRRWGTGRLLMLDTIHEYALGLLDGSPAADEIHRRHADFFLALAESMNLNAGLTRSAPMRLDLAFLEQDNVREALRWAIASGASELGLAIAAALEQFWVTNDPREGMRWFDALLGMPGVETAAIELRAHALRSYGGSAYIAGHPEDAESLWERSLALFESLDDEHGRAVLLHRLGLSAMHRGALDRARELVEESDRVHERTGDLWGRAQTIGGLGAIARDAGEPERAYRFIEQSAEMALEVGVPWWQGGMLAELAALALNAGRLDEADRHARAALKLADELHDRAGRVFGIGLLAAIAAERGQREHAGHLWGVMDGEDAVAPLGGWRRHREACSERIRGAAGPDFNRGYAAGRGLTIDEGVALAMKDPV